MEDYFTIKNKLKSNNYANVTLVIGNESCDLDSAVCSIVYATFLHWQHNTIKCKVCTASKRNEECKDDIFVSILDVKREDFPLKTEVVFCLAEYGIMDKDLIFRDDIDIEKLVSEGRTKIILVDHHVLAKAYSFLAPYVTEIIDHRPMDKSQWGVYTEEVRSTVELVGSCCTLVGKRVRDLSSLIAKEADFFIKFPACTRLLYSTILLDTVNFSKEVDKATRQDVDIVLFLEEVLNIEQCVQERKAKVDRLLAARSDVSRLSAAQLLRKDMKIFGNIFVPSFPVLVKDFLQKPNALEAVSEALSTHKCSLGLLLGMDLQGELRRDGAVISSNGKSAEKLAKFLQEWTSPPLQLVPDPDVNSFYFQQMNLSASRKQYVPALNEFLNISK